MRCFTIFTVVACIVLLILSLTTAFSHDRTRRGPVDLSGFTGSGICIFWPCPVQPFVFPEIDWDAVHASIAQWNKEREQQLSQTEV
ncbi:unnamed protein product [Didymodactylos carnosus]|uniref:Uncharacterized protein n=1 Tax=Didymodactylos carnosus TaxID=1234261 RepID=A0A814NB80_9BILA|nr:unnamed protein product [Didymodactylos carnosus]CAF1122798.1 unnamed protein product [Didymodactylos carnosus]CAF3855330.1 unnamed protein product [Didymodactylos carnosus]CAF3898206.1 unnamed protein product [Didymodactylos carnosus]